jgi:hypothetical protein
MFSRTFSRPLLRHQRLIHELPALDRGQYYMWIFFVWLRWWGLPRERKPRGRREDQLGDRRELFRLPIRSMGPPGRRRRRRIRRRRFDHVREDVMHSFILWYNACDHARKRLMHA